MARTMTHGATAHGTKPAEFATPVRNHYFYGKLLDVFHFEQETAYMNDKRWLLNRVVTGWGVVCGLDVVLVDDGTAVVVTSGLAIDKWGREIIVPTESPPVPLPDEEPWGENGSGYDHDRDQESPEQQGGKGEYPDDDAGEYHVVICYHECLSGSSPVLAGECGSEGWCMPGTLEERYRVEIRPGHVDPIDPWDCHIPDAITGGQLQYEVLVDWVTNSCPELPDDPCVPLANITVHRGDEGPYCEPDDVDINIRQVALSNLALFYLLMSMLYEASPRRRR